MVFVPHVPQGSRMTRPIALSGSDATPSEQEDLLDIHRAAQFLNVSETSLRRWTNAGSLACFRLGRKRERRFRRSDLLAFAGGPSPLPSGSSQGPRSHLCGLYASDLSRVTLAAAFLAEALEPRRVCFLAAAHTVRDQILGDLEQRRPSLHTDVNAGRLVLSEYATSVPAQCAYWETSWAAAAKAGAQSFCVVGDVSGGALSNQLERYEVIEYERRYDEVSQRFPVTTLCLYDVRRSSGLEVLDLLKCHRDLFRHPVETVLS
jgi:excisionase family DNA binding protein